MKEACDRHGCGFDLYYSQAQDWHHPDGYMGQKDNSQKNYRRYLDEKMPSRSSKRFLTQYGDIALIWFDTPMGTTYEESREMVELVKRLQPNCLVSGRIGNGLGEYLTTSDNFIFFPLRLQEIGRSQRRSTTPGATANSTTIGSSRRS